ncbi:hypothetical protein Q3G72_009924 [Acer saccharum]|nr:hypothetical protein Q3G72_009924 [Acer saccharum]
MRREEREEVRVFYISQKSIRGKNKKEKRDKGREEIAITTARRRLSPLSSSPPLTVASHLSCRRCKERKEQKRLRTCRPRHSSRRRRTSSHHRTCRRCRLQQLAVFSNLQKNNQVFFRLSEAGHFSFIQDGGGCTKTSVEANKTRVFQTVILPCVASFIFSSC